MICAKLLFAGLAGLASAAAKQCVITDYGAKTTSSDNTKAIQQAIGDCINGGEVVVPAGGHFMTYPLLINNGMGFRLTLASGAILRAGARSGWPVQANNYVDFLKFVNCSGCSLQGRGLIDGQGTPWYIDFDKGIIKANRPHFVAIEGGSNFKLLDVTLLNSPKFNVITSNLVGGEIARINITSQWYDNGSKEPHNTDGIDPGSNSRNIHIHDCYIHNGDDSVAIKPGTIAGGCTRDILVENCHFEKGHGCSIGSVGKGCAKNIHFKNITMAGQECGCRIKTYSEGAGFVSNITWESIKMTKTGQCITVNAEYKPTPPGATNFIKVSDIHLTNVAGSGCGTDAEFICPKQQPCTGIVLKNVHTSGGKEMSCSNAYGEAADSMKSCLKPDHPTPHPAPSPKPPPTPKPSPSPGCDVDGCLSRCVKKYGGSVAAQGTAYMCAKGCAGMKGGKVSDPQKYCKLAPAGREAACTKGCATASSSPEGVAECRYGCGFWG